VRNTNLSAVLLCFLLLSAAPAPADEVDAPPMAIPEAGHIRAERAFADFTASWMQKVKASEQEGRQNPTVQAGARQPVFTYKGYGSDYKTELRPTGHERAPFVGLLRYTEHTYSCESIAATNCRVASTMPVTEIFRYQDDRWSY